MNTTKYLSLAALALMGTLASCQSNDEAATNSFARPDNAVGINVSVGSLKGTTRSNAIATDDTQREFNQGDQISVSTDGQEAVIFQCTNADQQTWAEAEAGKFLLWTQNEMTFKAYYPATTGTSMTAFTLPADQSSTEKIALADYMTRQQTCTNVSGNNINLELERKTARVIVRIAGFNDQYRDDQKTVSNVRIYSEASDIEDGNPTGSSTEIQPYAQGTGGQGSTYTALVVPGYDDDGATFITLTDGEGNTLTVKGIPELEAGNSYTFNLTVGKNKIEVASVTVQDWTTGETLAGGQATEAAVPITVTWNNNDITGSGFGTTFTKDGVTITAGEINFNDKNFQDGGTFSTTLGNFTKIEVSSGGDGYCGASGTGWSGSTIKKTWTGNASSVSFSGDINGMGMGDIKFVFTIEPTKQAAPAYTQLSTIASDYTAQDGEILTGTLGSNVKISIADGATVTLKDLNINGSGTWTSGSYAGITCEGDATITLEGTNTVKGFANGYPGIFVSSGKTLVINGTGELNASSNGSYDTGSGGAGIGAGNNMSCGNIEIQSGTVTATGNYCGAGIGGGQDANCGNITISGGTVTATGGQFAAGIGGGKRGFIGGGQCGNITISGGTITATGGENAAGIGGGKGRNNSDQSSCGTITITPGVTSVTATKGSSADNSIGAGSFGTCGSVNIEAGANVTQN